jgi:hypothetical protein
VVEDQRLEHRRPTPQRAAASPPTGTSRALADPLDHLNTGFVPAYVESETTTNRRPPKCLKDMNHVRPATALHQESGWPSDIVGLTATGAIACSPVVDHDTPRLRLQPCKAESLSNPPTELSKNNATQLPGGVFTAGSSCCVHPVGQRKMITTAITQSSQPPIFFETSVGGSFDQPPTSSKTTADKGFPHEGRRNPLQPKNLSGRIGHLVFKSHTLLPSSQFSQRP